MVYCGIYTVLWYAYKYMVYCGCFVTQTPSVDSGIISRQASAMHSEGIIIYTCTCIVVIVMLDVLHRILSPITTNAVLIIIFKNCSDIMSDQFKQWSAMARQCQIIANVNIVHYMYVKFCKYTFVQHRETMSNEQWVSNL